MLRTGLVFGGLAGAVIIASMILGFVLASDKGASTHQWLGYLIMLVGLTLIFVGMKCYRDYEKGGVIKFVEGAKLGAFMALIAGVVYVATWEAYTAITDNAFAAQYQEAMIQDWQEQGIAGTCRSEARQTIQESWLIAISAS